MSIPAHLAPGLVSIYGLHQSTMGFSFPNENTDLAFGTVYQLVDNAMSGYAVGNSVLFPFRNATALIYGNVKYYIVPESTIILVENEPEIS